MRASRLRGLVAGGYVALAGLCIAYELSIRLYDRGNSEFAGMLSFALTLPSSVLVSVIGASAFGVRVGDSDRSFVTLLGIAALVNGCLIYVVLRALRKVPPR